MKRNIIGLFLGLFLVAAAYCGFYRLAASANGDLARSKTPELAWLKREFKLSDADLARITELHEAYRPHCVEMCRRIDASNTELRELLNKTNTLTPEIEMKLAETAELRGACQKAMLRHFMEVSRTMPPQQGKRYLAWVEERTFLADYGMMQSNQTTKQSPNTNHEDQ
jgi:hypothetical protein